jgi:hypothetical protein
MFRRLEKTESFLLRNCFAISRRLQRFVSFIYEKVKSVQL